MQDDICIAVSHKMPVIIDLNSSQSQRSTFTKAVRIVTDTNARMIGQGKVDSI